MQIAITYSPYADAPDHEMSVVFLTPADLAALLILVEMSPMISALADMQKLDALVGDAATDA